MLPATVEAQAIAAALNGILEIYLRLKRILLRGIASIFRLYPHFCAY